MYYTLRYFKYKEDYAELRNEPGEIFVLREPIDQITFKINITENDICEYLFNKNTNIKDKESYKKGINDLINLTDDAVFDYLIENDESFIEYLKDLYREDALDNLPNSEKGNYK